MTSEFVPSADRLIEHNTAYAAGFDDSALQVAPARQMAVVACMDARIDTYKILGLENGAAHIIRNAGGVITDDVIRSLCLSQRKMDTREIVLIHHTDCGLHNADEAAFQAELQAELGVKPRWSLEAFGDPFEDTRQSMRRIMMTPFLPFKDHVRGFVYDVRSGLLTEVELPA
ncbi:MAG: carbonic anhydrase [Actinobacteria bacterium]|nr:carbonic anhydrase [Actinomycetota bacterium]